MNPVYSVIVPCYNEEACILETHKRLSETMQGMDEAYEILYVNDGSRDKTPEMLNQLQAEDAHVKVIHFARNAGHQLAVSAGMDYAAGDAVVIIDADLQDPPYVIPQMAERWKAGAQVVYGKRRSRKGESKFKEVTAHWFYRVMNKLSGNLFPEDTGDFRLADRQVVEVLKKMPEHARYLRGMFAWAGFKQEALLYDREARFAGETHYPLKKMLKLAANGIISFSDKPLTWSLWAGLGWLALTIILVLNLLVRWIVGLNNAIAGLATLITLGVGSILVALGILGAYLARVYDEAKGRPLYVVAQTLGFEKGAPPIDKVRIKA